MPPPKLGKLIASHGEATTWLNADALGVPRGPCRMCHRCPGLPGFGLLRWPQLEEEVLEMGGNVPVGSKALAEMGSRCRRCDCPGHQHQNLEQWLGDVKKRCKEMRLIVSWYRPIPQEFRLPMVSPSWTRSSSALFALTDGVFDPRKDGVKKRRLTSQGDDRPLISVIAPTSFARHGFHPLLYECFCKQDYDPKELIIVDTGPKPSAFFSELRDDPRVIYRHFVVADSRLDLPEGWRKGAPVYFGISDQELWTELGLEPKAWSLGLKRNVAIELAAGEIIAHFDDDDLYAPGYLSWMHERLGNVLNKDKDPVISEYIESKLPPAAVTLRAWHLLDLSDMTFGYMDVENDPLVPKDQRYGWLFGWGFSYMFTRSCWELTPVPDVEWSEDISFYEELKRLKVPVVPVHPPSSSAICAHSYHAKVNTSGGEFAGAVRCGTALQETPKALMDLMPLAEAAASCVSSRIGSRDQSIGEKSGFRVNLSEKREFLQCRGQAWFAYQQQKISDRKVTKTVSVATWPSS